MKRPSRDPVRGRGAAWVRVLLLCALWAAATPATSARAEGPSPPPPILTLQQPHRASLEGGASQIYVLELAAGTYLELEVEQIGINVGLFLRDPEGTSISEGNTPNGDQGIEPLIALATRSGRYELEVKSLLPKAPPGEIVAQLKVARPAGKGDPLRAAARQEAWVALQEGLDLASSRATADERRRSIAALRRAAPLWAEVGDLDQQARALNSMGVSHRILGETTRAQQLYEEALTLWRRAGNRQGEGDQLYNLGRLYGALGELDRSAATLAEAREIRRRLGDRRGEARALTQLGTTRLLLGELAEAKRALDEAQGLSNSLGDAVGEAQILAGLARLHTVRNDLEQAIDAYRRELEIWRRLGHRPNQAASLNNLGTRYERLGELEEARRFYEEALTLAREQGYRAGEAFATYNLGWSYRVGGEADQARLHFERALDQWTQQQDQRGRGLALTGLAGSLTDLGRPGDAVPHLEEALAVGRRIRHRTTQILAHLNLGEARLRLGTPDAAESELAEAQFFEALRLSREVGYAVGEALAATGLAQADRRRGRLAQARNWLEEAIAITDELRSRVTSHDHRATFFASHLDRYEIYVDLLMEMHRREPAAGHDAAALAASERSRARSLLDLLTESGTEIEHGVDVALLERQEALRERLNALETRRLQLDTGVRESEDEVARGQREDLAAAVAAGLQELREVQGQIRAASPRYAALTQPEPAGLSQLQGELLDDQTLLLEISLGRDRSFLWLVGRETLRSVELPPRPVLEELAHRLLEAIRLPGEPAPGLDRQGHAARREAGRATVETTARELGRILLGPIADELGDRRLVVVADGALQALPFGVLQVPGRDGLLVERHEILQLPSASTLLLLRRELASRPPAPRQLAVLADPIFQPTDSRLTLEEEPATRAPSAGGFRRLRFTRREAEAIAALAGDEAPLLLLGLEANRTHALDGRLRDYRLVHFATHGVLDGQRPELSAIVLSQVDGDGQPVEGFLRLNDIYNLELNADLVTLSACRSALGREVRGEGLVGLTRGFMYAGAARVVASLWQVPDRASALLMEELYRGMLQDGLSAAAALRRAKLTLHGDRRWSEPYFWAAFQIQGDWR